MAAPKHISYVTADKFGSGTKRWTKPLTDQLILSAGLTVPDHPARIQHRELVGCNVFMSNVLTGDG